MKTLIRVSLRPWNVSPGGLFPNWSSAGIDASGRPFARTSLSVASSRLNEMFSSRWSSATVLL